MVSAKQIWKTVVSSEKVDTLTALAFNNDGSRLVVSSGLRVLLYNCNDGSIIKQLKGHKDKIYSVSYSHDGSRIASGGADKSTIIWNEEGKGILKFTHADSVQVVSYSPVEDVLLSCSSSDFGFWSPQDKSVIKHKVDSKILCASWRNDGHVIALGLFSGKISLYNIHGDEIGAIARNAPVWSVSWNRYEYSSNDFTSDILAVGSWDMTLSFYDEFYQQLNEDQCLDYYPSSVAYYGRSSEYIIVGSSSGNLDLFSKDGIFLKNIGNHTGWIWCAKGVDEKQVFACVDSSGILAYYHLTDDEPIRDKWKECLAYRDSCTDVVVHDASMDRTRRIRCNDFVKAISLLQNEIAVAMRERIIIYDISSSIDECRVKHCIDTMMPFKLIKMTSNHIFICMEKKIIAYSTRGEMVREWNLRQNVLCIQNLCAIPGEESVLVGCQDGKVLVVAINSPFCTTLLKLKSPIVSIDVSCNSRYIGMICDGNNLVIFDQIKKSCVQDMKGPKSIFFHDEIECMYCYGNDGIVTIKDIHLRGFSQVESGRGCTVHFSGTQISYLQKDLTVHHIDINLTSLAYQKAKNRDFEDAFKIALLGSSHDFFTYLAKEALLNSNYSVSMKCYRHLDIPSMTEYVQRQRLKAPQDCTSPNDARVIIATDIALLENNFSEASDIFKKAGMSQKLIEYNVKMRKFEEAKEVLEKNDKTNYDFIIMKEAEWEEQMKNWKRASSLFLECKCYLKAVNLVGEFKGEGWIDAMCNLNQSIPNKEIEALKRCCHYLSGEEGLDETIKSILLRIKDYSSLMHLYVKNNLWIEIAQLCQQHEHDIDKCLMLPYADWLAVQARLNEALAIYRKADRQDKSIKLLLSLIDMSILEEDFKETSMLYRTLAKETLVKNDKDNGHTFTANMHSSEHISHLFYAYTMIADSFSDDLIHTNQSSPEGMINVCAYLLHSLDLVKIPHGVSIVKILRNFAKQAKNLNAFQAARIAYNRIREEFIVPPNLHCEFALEALTIQSTPQQDNPDIIPICYRCGSSNPLIDKKSSTSRVAVGDSCRTCFHPFVRCFVTFDILPLIEFKPETSIPEKDVLDLIYKYSPQNSLANEFFNESINLVLSDTEVSGYAPVKVDRRTLESFNREEVYATKTPFSDKVRFYKNMIPEIGIAICHECRQFFHEEDYEYEFLKQGGCPFCKTKTHKNYGHV